MKKLKAIFAIIRSDGYAVATNREAMMSFPNVDLENISDIILLSAQRSALESFAGNIESIIVEHESAVELLQHRQKGKNGNRNTNAKRKSTAKK